MGIDWLVEPSLALTAGLLAALALRNPIRRHFGAAAAYAAWLLVPASLLALLLPAASSPVLPTLAVFDGLPFARVTTGEPVGQVEPLPWAIGLWAFGALAALAWQLRQQSRFARHLGPVTKRPDGLFQSLATRGLPAVVGLRQRIVLPGDFETRYAPAERELVLAHERLHRQRGDLLACLFAASARVVFWFNPLVHLADARFRHDQELACDAAVLARYPAHRRAYADAMLKTQFDRRPLPLGCHWRGIHPLTERIAMLKNPLPSRSRKLAGFTLVLASCLLTAAAAWAAQSGAGAAGPDSEMEVATVQVSLDAKATTAREAALRIARQAGLDIENPEALDDQARFDLAFNDIPARAALALVAQESGMQPVFSGRSVRYQASAARSDGMAEAGIGGQAPAYPKAAADAGQGGTVMLKVLVGTDGAAREVQFVADKSTVAADSEIARSAIDAAARWRFNPGMVDGKPFEGWVLVPVRFEPPAAAPEA